MRENRVFGRPEWIAFWMALLISLGVFVYTLAPTVTLEDSGELVVAADHLGVPHPPGYPLWTIVSWLFTVLFSFVTWQGHPNPAWGVNLVSGFFGALTSGLVALLVSRTGRDLVKGVFKAEESPTEGVVRSACGMCAGLLLSFSPIMWSQCVIAEVYSLNTFLHVLIMVFAYVWMQNPEKNSKYIYAAAVTFGVGITNCQPIVLIIPALLAMMWHKDRKLFRDSVAALFIVVALVILIKLRVAKQAAGDQPVPNQGLMVGVSVICLLAPVVMWVFLKELFTEWKRVLIAAVFVGIGLSLFLYMPISSETNPPMNWGYPRTWEGFKHAVTRGQYQKLNSAWPWSSPLQFLRQEGMFLLVLEQEFTLPIALLALVPFLFIGMMNRENRWWMLITGIAFYFLSFIIVILNPGWDIQSMFIARVQFVQAIAVFVMWVGYALLLLLVYMEKAWSRPGSARAVAIGLALGLPMVLVFQNIYNIDMVEKYGSCEQTGHDFGWQFGRYQLEGADGIKAELTPDEPPLPNPEFPLEMTTNAIFYGGTDPGRFVPTYMIYSADVRSDVYLITQNALADNTYMNVMRDLYGDRIWIPSAQDCNKAFQQYIQDVKEGKIPQNASINVDPHGRVSVQGVQGVMEINGIIAKMIFEANKSKHDFYVEESYVIQWMYPYLEPHGLIMKINKEPLPELTPEMIKNDREFWDWYTARLLRDEKFHRDVVARKSFSKLRCAIGGVYAYRNLLDQAEYAYKQAVELYPVSPEANFRLADVYVKRGEVDKAIEVMKENGELDPHQEKIKDFLNQLKNLKATNEQIAQLQARMNEGKASIEDVLRLIDLFRRVGNYGSFYGLSQQVIGNTNLPSQAYLQVAQMYATTKPIRYDFLAKAFEAYVAREPGNPRAWIDLAATQVTLGRNGPALGSLRQAVKVGGDPVRDIVRQDARFARLRNSQDFQKIVTPVQRRFSF